MKRFKRTTLISNSKKHRINYQELISSLGENTAFLVLKILFNDRGPDYLKTVLPKRMSADSKFEWVLEKLKTSGIKTETYYEDFVDEDTGEVVEVERNKFKIFEPKK